MPHEASQLATLIDTFHPRDAAIAGLFEKFFCRTGFDADLVSLLIRTARDPAQSWALRRISVLMLDHEALCTLESSGFGDRSRRLLEELGLIVEGRVLN